MDKIRQQVRLFSGPEAEGKRERIDSIRKSMSAARGESPEEYHFYPYETDINAIMDLLRNASLFSPHRLVILADVHALNSAEVKILSSYIAKPAAETVLILTTDESPASRNYPRTLEKHLPKAAVEVFWELFQRDRRGWVNRFFHQRKLSVDSEALDILLDITEGTTDALREACEFLAFFAEPGGRISEDLVDGLLEHGRMETVYSLFDRFCRRDLSGVLEAYQAMLHSDPGAAEHVLSRLAHLLTNLHNFRILIDQRLSPEEAAGKLKLKGGKRGLRSYTEGARLYKEGELSEALRSLVEEEAWLRTAPGELRKIRTELWFCRMMGHAA